VSAGALEAGAAYAADDRGQLWQWPAQDGDGGTPGLVAVGLPGAAAVVGLSCGVAHVVLVRRGASGARTHAPPPGRVPRRASNRAEPQFHRVGLEFQVGPSVWMEIPITILT
jgi:hypothetical protein